MIACPRCGSHLYPELDPDYGTCLIHGPVFVGVPLEPIETRQVKYAPRPSRRKTEGSGSLGHTIGQRIG